MRRCVAILAIAAAACGRQAAAPTDTPGARLEAAATAAGLVADTAKTPLVGAWALDTDRACIVPGDGARARIGVLVDYGERQGCAATGTVSRSGDGLDVRFGGCRMRAGFDGDRIVFPAEAPAECDRFCVGRASLAALVVERQSGSVSEAATLRTPSGRPLCPAD